MKDTNEIERTWMKKCCENRPFKVGTKLTFSTEERAYEIAGLAYSPMNNFPCHTTAVINEDDDGGYVHGEHSFTCHGFLEMQINETGYEVDGFISDGQGFGDVESMLNYNIDHGAA